MNVGKKGGTMPPALAALALLALTNPAAPGHALWNVTPPDPLDPIPRTRHARARADHPCLLYTSPSPRDTLLSRMPSSA